MRRCRVESLRVWIWKGLERDISTGKGNKHCMKRCSVESLRVCIWKGLERDISTGKGNKHCMRRCSVESLRVQICKGLERYQYKEREYILHAAKSSKASYMKSNLAYATDYTQTAHTLYLDRLSRAIVSRHAMLRFHVMFFD